MKHVLTTCSFSLRSFASYGINCAPKIYLTSFEKGPMSFELNYNVTHKSAHGSGCWGSALRLLIESWFLLFFYKKV